MCSEKTICSVETFPKKASYLLRKYDFSFEMFSKKVNYLLRKNMFIHENAKVTPKCDELTCFEYLWGEQLNK